MKKKQQNAKLTSGEALFKLTSNSITSIDINSRESTKRSTLASLASLSKTSSSSKSIFTTIVHFWARTFFKAAPLA
jgi:hypothetical protein